MLKVLFWAFLALGAMLVLDRVLLWMETRGWVYWRRTKKRGGGALYHTLEMHSVFEPGVQEIIEVKYGEEQEQDQSGDPPGPGDDDDVTDGGGEDAPLRDPAPSDDRHGP